MTRVKITTSAEAPTLAANKNSRRSKIVVALLAVLLAIALGLSGYFYVAYQNALSQNPTEERKRLVQALRQVAELPDEEPEIATVQDAAKLTSSALVGKTANGDKLLVFKKAKRIFIFRPSNKKVVDILSIQATTN